MEIDGILRPGRRGQEGKAAHARAAEQTAPAHRWMPGLFETHLQLPYDGLIAWCETWAGGIAPQRGDSA
jgi:hypothetical protein